MKIDRVEPAGWSKPKGYANGMRVHGAGSFIFVAGQIAWDAEQRLVGEGDFVAQFERALRNVVAVVEAGGGKADSIVRMTVYVTDKARYLACQRELGDVWRAIMARHFPAMALVEVSDLVETGALVEIEATAALA